MPAWRDGIGGGFLDTAEDMTLRLDNARALPTGPGRNNSGLISIDFAGDEFSQKRSCTRRIAAGRTHQDK
jgi:hypothetical protein